MKKWYMSKTMWAGIAMVVGGVAELMMDIPANASVGTIIAGVVMVVLRFVTNQPVGK